MPMPITRIRRFSIYLLITLESVLAFAPHGSRCHRWSHTWLSSCRSNNVFAVNWEGCLADAVPWRIQVGIETAVEAWPEIASVIDWEDTEWLRNKLSALSHVFHQPDEHYSIACEYALAARLLLEEQELDGGRSNGLSGKYASRFHPKSAPHGKSSGRGSRPLTVGEIAVNWAEGAMIRETLRTRYHCDFKDPFPILQGLIDRKSGTSEIPTPNPKLEALRALSKSKHQNIVFVSHPSDVLVAGKVLELAAIPHAFAETTEQALEAQGGVVVMVKTKDTFNQLLVHSDKGSVLHIVESIWVSLNDNTSLFGDYIPRHGRPGQCVVDERYLSLRLATWAANTDPSQHASATMNPWTNLISLEEFEDELVNKIRTF